MPAHTRYVLRTATAADEAALRALIPRSARALSAGHYTAEQAEAAIEHIFGLDTVLVSDGTYFIVESSTGELAGCGGWSRRCTLFGGDQRKAKEDPLLDPASDAARIRAFFVAPEHARQGVGTLLMSACVDAARAAGFRRLELMATLPGVPLYEVSGFQAVERVEEWLPGSVNIPFVRMERQL